MNIDVKSLSRTERDKLRKDLDAVEQEEKEAYKREFVDEVVNAAISKGVKWSEALALLGDYVPESDARARKLGFKFKGKSKEDKTVYYIRKMKGASEL
jgi:ribosomal protein L34